MYEVWDRVTGEWVGEYETREDAEDAIAGPHRSDYEVFELEDDAA